jgi:lysophospholipase L1-like esterase
MIYLIANSVSLMCDVAQSDIYDEDNRYPILIDAVMYPWCFTIIEAYYQFQQIRLKPEDVIVFNIGVNDCIYRKDKYTQKRILGNQLGLAIYRNDVSAVNIYTEKIRQVESKRQNTLFQLLSFEMFEAYLDKIFQKVKCKGIVMSVNWFPESHNRIGWAYNEIEKTNEILKRKTEQYGLHYIDLWSDKVDRTFDGVHLTEEGHKYIGTKINQVILQ